MTGLRKLEENETKVARLKQWGVLKSLFGSFDCLRKIGIWGKKLPAGIW